MLPAWVYVVVIGVASNAYTFAKLYKTASSRAALVASGESNPALLFLYGRLNGNSVGALTAWRYGVWGALFAALMSVFLVIRHTRGDEEAGRLELIGSARVGRQAPLAVGDRGRGAGQRGAHRRAVRRAARCLASRPPDRPRSRSPSAPAGSRSPAISAVAAQLTAGARAARGLAIGVLGVAFLARAVGDSAGASGPAWLTWVLPLGWTETLRPFAGERWWVLALPLALFAAGAWLAFALAARRDHGAGLFPDRPGRPAASGRAARPVRARVAAAVAGARGLGGRVRGHVRGLRRGGARASASSSAPAAALTKEFTRLGGQSAIVNAYLAALMLLGGLVAAAYGVSAVLRLRAEETAGRADPVLAGSVGRARWGLSHLAGRLRGHGGPAGGGGHRDRTRLRPGRGRRGRRDRPDARRGPRPAPRGGGDRRRRGAGLRRGTGRVRGGRAGRRSGSPCC